MKDPNLLNVWLGWLRDLGGDYPVVRDTSDPKPKTGRRDPAAASASAPAYPTDIEVPPRDVQVGGQHYTILNPQPWDVYENWLGRDGFVGYLTGTVIKYLCRFKNKNGVEDLKKARHFLDKLIELEESKCRTT